MSADGDMAREIIAVCRALSSVAEDYEGDLDGWAERFRMAGRLIELSNKQRNAWLYGDDDADLTPEEREEKAHLETVLGVYQRTYTTTTPE